MLTVIVCFDSSGNSSARNPFGQRYSVMPSTDVTRTTPDGSAALAWPAGAADCAATGTRRRQKTRHRQDTTIDDRLDAAGFGSS